MAPQASPRKLWEHPDPESTQMGQFRRALEKHTGQHFQGYHDLHNFSITQRATFWDFCWKYANLIHEGSYASVVNESARMDSIPHWFSGIQLNFAENLLFSASGDGRSTTGKEDEKIAVVEVREGTAAVPLTWKALRSRTGRLMQAMKAHGVKKGDRIAICASNSIDTLLVFLATTALGAIFSSSSTDMGVKGILDRLLQIRPRLLFMDDQAVYNGKTIDLRSKMTAVVKGMQSVGEFQGIVSQSRFASRPLDVNHVPKAQPIAAFLAQSTSNTLEFERMAFCDPFLIVYSSGTTGQPKCIAHSVGGVLLNAYKEGQLHMELDEASVVLQYTTTGWIMYLSAIQTLLFGSRVILYDGSPFLPHLSSLIKLAEQQRVTHFGTSPRYMYELQKANIQPRQIANLSSLTMVTSTGMVLPESLFEWFYDQGFPPHVRLNNISGGTDLAGCFGIGNSLLPVYVGGCAGMSLGIPVDVYDPSIEGAGVQGVPVEPGAAGELVATAAFPNMPACFWGPNGHKRYHGAYFARFDNVWTHGDFVSVHPVTKQLFFHGRADGVLNPSGVRFGSSEIYQVIESEFPSEVVDSICVGQRRPSDTDERVVLFLLLKPGVVFTPELVGRVKAAIRQKLSSRHVPTFIFDTPEIPTTVNGKKVELPVKQIVSGKKIKPSGTLLNPQCLDYYYQFAEVERLAARGSKLTTLNGSHDIAIVRATVDSVPAVLHLLDTAVKWLVSQDRIGQWGAAPFSENPKNPERLREFATTGHGLWLAIKVADDTPVRDQNRLSDTNAQTVNGDTPGVVVGALAIGDKMPYVPSVSEPELYVRLLVTDRQCAGNGIGKRLLDHARHAANSAGVSLLRVDCYAGGDGKLVQYYESQGFKRLERLNLEGDWPCQVLAQRLDAVEGDEGR
ncbi:acetoacetyl-CoA synthase [Aspergillus bombycis]|uniref:Acetoacetyl-CoA synthase n=1 Tax=Aspergillus bombycis TaxID=109264 RepID=A0A1F8A0Z2_9EURO|nr:acetoacetyl-CoA synthase [Aspergillus bombycis]OGM45400.1 acetoacetyl-CoA synthase [Aspergillus bombycis]